MLRERLTVGIIGAAFAIVVLCLNAQIIAIALAFVSIIGLSEIYGATGLLKKQNKLCVLGYIYTVVQFAILAFSQRASFTLSFMVCVYGFMLFIYLIFKHNETDYQEICELFFSTVYVSALFGYIVLLRKETLGNYMIWIIFITAWLSDTMAFAIGRKFGKTKLLPEISPKKTIEGAVGGLLGSVVFNLIFGIICSVVFGRSVYYLQLIVLALLAGVMSQLGDLAASCIKREFGIKDFGSLLPGHGGILDRFDSVLFVAPIVYYFTVVFSVIA